MEKIDTPFGIHAEFVSDRAVKNCINMYKKEQKRITPGKNGPRGRVSKHLKDSLDLGLESSEITRLKIYYNELHKVIDNYVRKFPILKRFNPWGYVDGINIQYYKPGGGYHAEHTETMSYAEGHRLFVFMTYLTDTKDGGTEWTYLNWKSPCKKGLTLLWPSNYPYSHKGIISNSEEKMIITGWFGFDKEYKDK